MLNTGFFMYLSFFVGAGAIVAAMIYFIYIFIKNNILVSISDVDFPSFKIVNESIKEVTSLFSQKVRGSVRISNTIFLTDKEYNMLRKKAFSQKLP